jgi:two-component sensor histidine kinase
LSDDIVLIVSELTTNAVQAIQAGSGRDSVRLRLVANSTHVAALVWDPTAATPRLRDVTSDDEDGRGLAIVEALSTERGWSFSSTPRAGKIVWALLEITRTERNQESPMQQDALFPFERT